MAMSQETPDTLLQEFHDKIAQARRKIIQAHLQVPGLIAGLQSYDVSNMKIWRGPLRTIIAPSDDHRPAPQLMHYIADSNGYPVVDLPVRNDGIPQLAVDPEEFVRIARHALANTWLKPMIVYRLHVAGRAYMREAGSPTTIPYTYAIDKDKAIIAQFDDEPYLTGGQYYAVLISGMEYSDVLESGNGCCSMILYFRIGTGGYKPASGSKWRGGKVYSAELRNCSDYTIRAEFRGMTYDFPAGVHRTYFNANNFYVVVEERIPDSDRCHDWEPPAPPGTTPPPPQTAVELDIALGL